MCVVWGHFRQVLSYSVCKFSDCYICRHRRRAKPFSCTYGAGRGCAPLCWPHEACPHPSPGRKGPLQVKEELTASASCRWCTAGVSAGPPTAAWDASRKQLMTLPVSWLVSPQHHGTGRGAARAPGLGASLPLFLAAAGERYQRVRS